jgi:hypothetical protein
MRLPFCVIDKKIENIQAVPTSQPGARRRAGSLPASHRRQQQEAPNARLHHSQPLGRKRAMSARAASAASAAQPSAAAGEEGVPPPTQSPTQEARDPRPLTGVAPQNGPTTLGCGASGAMAATADPTAPVSGAEVQQPAAGGGSSSSSSSSGKPSSSAGPPPRRMVQDLADVETNDIVRRALYSAADVPAGLSAAGA